MGEVIRGVEFGGTDVRQSISKGAQLSKETAPNFHELSEDTLMNTALVYEIRLYKANKQLAAGDITFEDEELNAASAGAMAIGSYLTEEQQIQVQQAAKIICDGPPDVQPDETA
jgi:hypothetical protein